MNESVHCQYHSGQQNILIYKCRKDKTTLTVTENVTMKIVTTEMVTQRVNIRNRHGEYDEEDNHNESHNKLSESKTNRDGEYDGAVVLCCNSLQGLSRS